MEAVSTKLNSRHISIIEYAAHGIKIKHIGEALRLPRHSVDKYMETIREELGAANIAEVVYIAMKQGLIK